MSDHRKDVLEDCLSLRQDRPLLNVKFFRGRSDVISDEEFRAEICAAVDRKRSGEVRPNGAPKCTKPPIDLRAFVATI